METSPKIFRQKPISGSRPGRPGQRLVGLCFQGKRAPCGAQQRGHQDDRHRQARPAALAGCSQLTNCFPKHASLSMQPVFITHASEVTQAWHAVAPGTASRYRARSVQTATGFTITDDSNAHPGCDLRALAVGRAGKLQPEPAFCRLGKPATVSRKSAPFSLILPQREIPLHTLVPAPATAALVSGCGGDPPPGAPAPPDPAAPGNVGVLRHRPGRRRAHGRRTVRRRAGPGRRAAAAAGR